MNEENFNSDEVIEITKAISLLIDEGLGKMNIDQMEEIKLRHKLLVEQQMFWMAQGNYIRFHKDLKEYGNWLCDYIADVERGFWGE